MIYIAKRPFDHNGLVNKGNGWEQSRGLVPKGARVKISKGLGEKLVNKRILYKTKEEKKAYIVHRGGSWFEVRYGQKVQKVQGKQKAEALRDERNS
jgi:hypothetical protein